MRFFIYIVKLKYVVAYVSRNYCKYFILVYLSMVYFLFIQRREFMFWLSINSIIWQSIFFCIYIVSSAIFSSRSNSQNNVYIHFLPLSPFKYATSTARYWSKSSYHFWNHAENLLSVSRIIVFCRSIYISTMLMNRRPSSCFFISGYIWKSGGDKSGL